jgi:hypothetical protein
VLAVLVVECQRCPRAAVKGVPGAHRHTERTSSSGGTANASSATIQSCRGSDHRTNRGTPGRKQAALTAFAPEPIVSRARPKDARVARIVQGAALRRNFLRATNAMISWTSPRGTVPNHTTIIGNSSPSNAAYAARETIRTTANVSTLARFKRCSRYSGARPANVHAFSGGAQAPSAATRGWDSAHRCSSPIPRGTEEDGSPPNAARPQP